MRRIIRYSFADIARSRWSYLYFAFYLVIGFTLLFLNHDLSKAIITLINIVILLTPLIGTVFGVMFYYNSQEFTEILLAQPLKRSTIFLGQYLGLSLSLTASLIFGLGIPFLFYGISRSAAVGDFVLLLVAGAALTFIFVALAFNIALSNENRIRGFAYSILLWLFLAVIYDGLVLLALVAFDAYPLDKVALLATAANPIDLSRILVLLKLDIAALLGYTGAVFQRFFGTQLGLLASLGILLAWVALPVWRMARKVKTKDF